MVEASFGLAHVLRHLGGSVWIALRHRNDGSMGDERLPTKTGVTGEGFCLYAALDC
ncbi:hypothetical protein D3C72_2458030 [compost metagenome]